jgi:hypothetical protein
MNYVDVFPFNLDPKTASDEQIAIVVREWRNKQLRDSDWTQMPDLDLVSKWDWAVYRQQLRDMMQQTDDPKLIVFPTPPV